MPSRRLPRISRAASALLAVLALLGPAAGPSAQAAAPMVHAQAPGYYRLMLGDFEVTALNDGTIDVAADTELHQPAAKTEAALAQAFLKSPVTTSVNAFLVNLGPRLVLFDTGTGGGFGPGAGDLAASLKAAGYAPEQVDDIFITHLHGDHIGGLSRGGNALFPNAVVHVGKADLDTAQAKAGNPFAPYAAAGRIKPIVGPGLLVPGVSALPTPGHTPGHTSFLVESHGQKLIVIGDLIHVAAVQLPDPGVTIAYDSDPKAAAAQRARIFGQAAHDEALIAAAHLQFPGIGHLRSQGEGWQFVPVNYTR